MSRHTAYGTTLRVYLAFSRIAEPLYRLGLWRRLKRDKEDPSRYREKLGFTDSKRPAGTLIWLHGVGLGEVLALRSLIAALHEKQQDLSFLVTSSTKTSATVFEKNCPANTTHQFLPVDAAASITRFLDHWQPELSVWAEQDLWPALVIHTYNRQIPLALVNARMNASSYQSRARTTGLYKNLYKRFEFISAQDEDTTANMRKLGADARTDGSLKAAATPLTDPVHARRDFEAQTDGRYLWLLASSHPEDEHLALQSHKQLLQNRPDALLIIAPRFAKRTDDISAQCSEYKLHAGVRSRNDSPADCQVYIADTFGEMGLWYRVCRCALIGGTNSNIEGHNPWEAAPLNCAIMHGPRTANFKLDYQSLAKHNAAHPVSNASHVVALLLNKRLQQCLCDSAMTLAEQNNHNIEEIAQNLLALINTNQPTAGEAKQR